MYNDAGSPTVVNCTFLLNSAPGYYESGKGGGMYNIAAGPTLIDCRFENNDADEGAGLYNEDSTLNLNGCTFQEHDNGAMANFDSVLRLVDCTFIENTAAGRFGRGGGMYNISSSSILLSPVGIIAILTFCPSLVSIPLTFNPNTSVYSFKASSKLLTAIPIWSIFTIITLHPLGLSQ